MIAQQVRAVSSLSPIMMIANIVNAAAIVVIRIQTESIVLFDGIWAGTVILLAGMSLIRNFGYRHKEFPREISAKTRNKLVFFAGVIGLLWSLPGLVMMPDAPVIVQAFLIMMAAGMVSGSAIALYPVPAAAMLCGGLIAVGHLIGFYRVGSPLFLAFFVVSVMFCIVIALSIIRHERIFVSEFRTRRALDIRNASVEQLLVETRNEAKRQQREAEKQLYQVQKMEAVGRLTAGIAHDFNNLLSVIMGNLELAQMSRGKDDIDDLLSEAHRASERGAELTRRLLAFGRKASLSPEIVDINEVIEQMAPLIKRTLLSSIQVELDLQAQSCRTRLDVSQFESALLNLAINARDAMEGKGRLVIGTRSAPGRMDGPEGDGRERNSVLIFVKDHGPGIPGAILSQVFEPFFTTKPVGKGSGLGLAMVYGFAQQSGGVAEISSELGVGTTVKLFFPCVATGGQAQPEAPPETETSTEPMSGSVLLVEDDPHLLRMTSYQLAKLGFDVTEAANGDEALLLLDSPREFDLLLTDFSMPGDTNGPRLLEVAQALRPGMKLLMMSSQPQNAMDAQSALHMKVQCLAKPVHLSTLRQAIRRVFDQKAEA